jgi:hypothetical protein
MATQDGAAEGFKMDPFTLQFCDPAYERDFIVSRASESLKPVWVLVWLLIVGLKLAHLIAASKWGQLHELHDDKGAVLASVACKIYLPTGHGMFCGGMARHGARSHHTT